MRFILAKEVGELVCIYKESHVSFIIQGLMDTLERTASMNGD